ncbi:MAG: 3-hydroxypropionyl-coenzyme A dehydratase [Candidatus Heimdallarchaeota archaeon LC_3]|nr:MAG: 3-hydroxypropionyl-coenzyme A dehydratase [Candidatus Heimdallarchaeota archaeon LC_3]
MTEFPKFSTLKVIIDTRNVIYVSLNRPEVHNAFNEKLIEELIICGKIIGDSDLRVIVLTGEGRSFCAGADLNYMKKSSEFTIEENIDDAKIMSEMFEIWNNLSKPIVGKINGTAIGGGIGLVSACDIAISPDNAKFGFSEVKLGIIPAIISQFVIPKIGISAAREYFLTGSRFTAETAKSINLINYVVPKDDLDQKVENIVEELLTSGPNAIKAGKLLIKNSANSNYEEFADYTIKIIAELRKSEEGQEGIEAFFSKRQANWIKKIN